MLCPLVVLNGFNSATTVYLNSHEEMVIPSSEQCTVWKLKELKSLLIFSRSWSKFPDCRKRNQRCCWRAASRQEVLLSHWRGQSGCSTSPTFSTGWGQDQTLLGPLLESLSQPLTFLRWHDKNSPPPELHGREVELGHQEFGITVVTLISEELF